MLASSLKAEGTHWAYESLRVHEPGKASNLVDELIGEAQRNQGVQASKKASRETLLRRVYFGLHGLPPTVQERAKFLDGEDSIEALVDELLASPRYGERWGRHWLDVARYADSLGYRYDDDIPHAYTYRDFVIRALNRDQPYDEFVRWQLAGDELAPGNREALAATGFLGVGARPRIEGTALNKLDARYIEIDDMVGTTFTGFLGLSMSCARCHDHKFDALSQEEYYGVAKAFLSGKRGSQPYQTSDEAETWAVWQSGKEAVDSRFREWQAKHKLQLDELIAARRAPLAAEREALEAEVLAKLEKGDEPEDAEHLRRIVGRQGKRILGAEKQSRWQGLRKQMQQLRRKTLSDESALAGKLGDDAMEEWRSIRDARIAHTQKKPADPDLCLAYDDESADAAPSPLMERGSVASPAHDVELMMPAAVGLQAWSRKVEGHSGSTQQRAALAEWITDAEGGAGHLLARVIVNRVWSKHFGSGLVRTVDDFGVQGDEPHLRDLLDALAGRLIEENWSLKWLHREIMTSATYQRSGAMIAESHERDPENLTWWRKPVLRLEGESLRDVMLAVSGRLVSKMHGPGDLLPIPKEVIISRLGKAYPSDIQDGPAVWRRSVYAFHKRTVPVPFFRVFDAPSASEACGDRIETTVPTQSLVIMNNDFVRMRAGDLVADLKPTADLVGGLFLRCYSREATATEREGAETFLKEQTAIYDGDRSLAEKDLAQAMMGANEFIYID